MKNALPIFFALLVFCQGICQENFSNDPLNAKFVTEDHQRFWDAFCRMDKAHENPFNTYVSNASPGLKPYAAYLHPDSIYQLVSKRKNDYLKSKHVLDDLESQKKRIQAIYAAMKFWYPRAKFPPIYFVVGMFTSGGTVSENGLLIGTELLENLDGLPGLTAHELIHFQQNVQGIDNLLKQSLIEGSADFIGELISGEHINKVPFGYGTRNSDKLCREFAQVMTGEDYMDWLYGTSGKDERPKDLGYWMGYKITETYFNKQNNKLQAINYILNIKDPYEFVKESGYLDKYLSR